MKRVSSVSAAMCGAFLWMVLPDTPAEPAAGQPAPPSPDAPLAALKDKDPKVRREAADALGRLRDKAATEPLVASLKDDDRGVRWSAAEALGAIGDTRAIEPLIAALSDQDDWVRDGVAEALGRVGDQRAVGPLRAALKRKDGGVSGSVASALAGILKDERAVEPLLAALEHPDSEWTGLAVMGSIIQIGPRAVKPLVAALRHPSVKVRRPVVDCLSCLGDASAVEPLIKALDDPDGDVAREVACALCQLDDPRAAAPLAAAIKDRRSAVWREGEPNVLSEKGAPISGLTNDAPAELAPLVAAIEDPHWRLRCSAAWVLGRMGDKRAVGAVVAAEHAAEQSRPGEEQMRGAWLYGQALARLQSPVGIAPIMNVIREHGGGERRPQDDMGSPELNDWWQRTQQKELAGAVEALAAIGPAAVDPLIALLKDENPNARAVAALALGRLGDKRAIEALQALRQDPEKRVQDAASDAVRAINHDALPHP